MSAVPEPKEEQQLPGGMGLKGIWGTVANATAVMLICVMFYQDRHSALQQAREDRQMFREELKALRQDSDRQWEEQQKLTRAVERLAEQVKGKSP